MLSQLLRLILAAVITVALLTTPAIAADEKKPEPKKEEKGKTGNVPFNGKVKSIDAVGLKLALPGGKDKGDRVFIINADTKITLEKKPAKFEDIKVGNYIGGSFKRDGDKMIATTINALLEAPAPKKKVEKK